MVQLELAASILGQMYDMFYTADMDGSGKLQVDEMKLIFKKVMRTVCVARGSLLVTRSQRSIPVTSGCTKLCNTAWLEGYAEVGLLHLQAPTILNN